MKKRLPKWLLFFAASLSPALFAASASAASCSFVSTMGVSFGAYDVFDPLPLDATGSLTFNCTGLGPGETILIELSAGSSGSALSRSMYQTSQQLSYNIFLDAAHNSIWGNGTSGTSAYGPVTPPNGTNQTVTMFGRIPARQNVSVGLYADSIIATILF